MGIKAFPWDSPQKRKGTMNSNSVSRIVLYIIAGLIVFAVASTTEKAYSDMMLSNNIERLEASPH